MGLASWLQRVGGYFIDGLIVGVPAWLGSCLAGVMAGDSGSSAAGTLISLLLSLVSLGLLVYNRWIMGGNTGQTWGRQVLNIRLISEQTGQPIGPGMAFVRDLAHIVDSLSCYIGWLFPLWDEKRQTFADKMLKTVVIQSQ